MDLSKLPILKFDLQLAKSINDFSDENDLITIEKKALENQLNPPFVYENSWISLKKQVLKCWDRSDYVILRGLKSNVEGITLLLGCLLISNRFKSYQGSKIVKNFKMSPWTKALSHTIKEGHFHTDINTAAIPPRITAMQCHRLDPGGDQYGQSRVARLNDLIQYLQNYHMQDTLSFLTERDVVMVDDTSQLSWTGKIICNQSIRFHPETLRAAQKRFSFSDPTLEHHISVITKAAFSVSIPFVLDEGDILLVSNTRALHYRGECSVVFEQFPQKFISREINVLHLTDEPNL